MKDTGVSRKKPQGVEFLFWLASNRTPPKKKNATPINQFSSVIGILYCENKVLVLKLARSPKGGVFILASLAEKDRQKNPNTSGFSRETHLFAIVHPPIHPHDLSASLVYGFRWIPKKDIRVIGRVSLQPVGRFAPSRRA